MECKWWHPLTDFKNTRNDFDKQLRQAQSKHYQQQHSHIHTRADSRLVPSLWETSLQSNTVSQWLGTNLESALHILRTDDPKEFWRHINRFRPEKSDLHAPNCVELYNGHITTDPDVVWRKWKSDFEGLYQMNQNYTTNHIRLKFAIQIIHYSTIVTVKCRNVLLGMKASSGCLQNYSSNTHRIPNMDAILFGTHRIIAVNNIISILHSAFNPHSALRGLWGPVR